jgi:hypothetical protein
VVRANIAAMRITRTMARQFLADVPEDKIFWSHDAKIFKNLNELAQGLMNMDDETYMFHANGYKNDFAKWVREVVGDHDLANDLDNTVNRLDASKKVVTRVNLLKSKM